jgi:hypothetical protein
MIKTGKQTKKKSLWKWARRLAVVLVLYAAVGFLVVPAVLKSQLIKRLPALTHRTTAVDKIRFNPFTLSLEISKLSLTEPSGEKFASFDDLFVEFDAMSSLFHMAWTLDALKVEKPFMQVTHLEDGSFNFSNLASTNSIAKSDKTPATKSVLPALIIRTITVSNGAVAFEDLDRVVKFKTTLTPINLSLVNISTIRGNFGQTFFDAHTDSGENFVWDGKISLNPLISEGKASVYGILLAKYAPYFHKFAGIDVSNGVFELQADYNFNSDSNGMRVQLPDVSVSVTNLSMDTADKRAHWGLNQFKSGASLDFQYSPTNNGPLFSVSNAWISMVRLLAQTPSGGETVFKLESFAVTFSRFSMPANEAHVGLVSLRGGEINARQNKDGSINLLGFLPPSPNESTAKSTTPTNNSAQQPFHLDVYGVALTDFKINAEDQRPAASAKLKLDIIDIHLSEISSPSSSPVDVSMAMRFQDTGSISISGKTTLTPFSTDLIIGLTNIDLRAAQPYLGDQISMAVTSGFLDMNGHAVYSTAHSTGPALRYDGRLAINKLATADALTFKDFAKWDSLDVDGIAMTLQPDNFHMDRVTLSGLNTSLVIGKDKRSNLQTILSPQNQTNAAKSTAAQSAPASFKPMPEISLGEFVLTNASLHFGDKSIEPNCSFDVQQFGGKVLGLSSKPDSIATVALSGKVDDRSPFSIDGRMNPLGTNLFLDLGVGFTNTDLTAFTPYTEHFVGRPLNKGKLSFGVHYLIKNKALKAANSFYLDQLTFGPKNDNPKASTLPVKLAVALLKDRHGRIQMDVPVEGRLDDPKFKLGPILWQVVENLITKAVTSPFSMLGSLVGGGPELSYVNFKPGESVLPDTETNKLNSLVKALYERPELTVELNGSVDPAKNRFYLAKRRLDQSLGAIWIKQQTATGKPPVSLEDVQLTTSERSRLLAMYYQSTLRDSNHLTNTPSSTNQDWSQIEKQKKAKSAIISKPTAFQSVPPIPSDIEMESKLCEQIVVSENDLRNMMKRRATAVQTYLIKVGKVEAERIFITAPKPMSLNSNGEDKVNLTLD